jgi:hypothetical protein
MLAGVVFLVDELLVLVNPVPFLDPLLVVALLLLAAGLVGFHALQKGSYGRIGRAGFYTAIAGCLAQALGLVGLLAGTAVLGWLLIVGSLGLLVGFVLYGAATLQARVLPRWCGIAFIVFLPVAILLGGYAPILGGVASTFGGYAPVWIGLVWLALGYVLWSHRGAAAEQPSRVS